MMTPAYQVRYYRKIARALYGFHADPKSATPKSAAAVFVLIHEMWCATPASMEEDRAGFARLCETLHDVEEHGMTGLENDVYAGAEWCRGHAEDIISSAALDDFWRVVANLCPDVKTGDFGPEDAVLLSGAASAAVRSWLEYNAPQPEPEEAAPVPDVIGALLPGVLPESVRPCATGGASLKEKGPRERRAHRAACKRKAPRKPAARAWTCRTCGARKGQPCASWCQGE